ncbi:MAG: TonB family protein [Desulfuromonadales bacterium]
MNLESKSLLLSLALHTGLICLAIALSNSIAPVSKEVVLDFSVINSNTPPAPQLEDPVKSQIYEIKSEKGREKQNQKLETPVQEKTLPATSPLPLPLPLPLPVAEAAGSVPIIAPGNQAVSAPLPHTTEKTVAHSAERGQVKTGVETANPVEQMTSRYLKQNFEYIKILIQKNIVYPAMARRLGLTGKVVVSFIITENGRAENEKILVSSGHNILDNNVIETIRMVEPFPKPPVRAELRIPILYSFN